MANNIDAGQVYQCYSRFIYNHGQKPSLTRVTDGKISSALHRIYPMLIIIDGALNNIMWICDDICLPFIYVVLVTLVIKTFTLSDSSEWSFLGKISTLWLGMAAFVILSYSFLYYIVTVHEDLDQYEPPTLDDIVILLESVLDKLETIRREALFQIIRIRSWLDFVKLAFFLTPLHYFLMRYVSVKDYTSGIVICCLFLHSVWFQSTLRLFWRVLFIRRIFYSIISIFCHRKKSIDNRFIDPITVIERTDRPLFVPYAVNLQSLSANKLQLELQRLYPLNEVVDDAIKTSGKSNVIAICEFIIHENQRKWKPDNTWQAKLLPYEKPKFCIEVNGYLNACKSPWEFQESSPKDWEWLDDCWKPTDWIYSDSSWNTTGQKDSLESYTRTNIWKRRVFKVCK